MVDVIARATAKICPLKYLTSSPYIKQEGWQPNYVQVGKDQISRVNIIGIVVQKNQNNAFIVDDGTGSIQVVDFSHSKNMQEIAVGNPVLVVGRPRQNEDELFIAAEIITSKQLLSEPHWLEERQKIIQSYAAPENNKDEDIPAFTGQLTGDDVVDFMRKKDTGTGVAIEEISAYFGTEVEEVIHTLLSMGEVYEVRAGVLKVLE